MKLLELNLRALKLSDPALCGMLSSLSPQADVCILRARTGDPVPKFKGLLLHSSYDPIGEARLLISNYDLSRAQALIILGFGFGYHVREALSRTSSPVLVVEKSLEILRSACEHVDLGDVLGKVRLVVGREPEAVLSDEAVKAALKDRPAIVPHPASVRCDPAYYDALLHQLDKHYTAAGRDELKVMVVAPMYGGSLPLARYSASGLRKLGCTVELIDCSPFYPSFQALGNKIREQHRRRDLEDRYVRLVSDYVYARAKEFDPDLIFALAQAPLSYECLKKLCREGARTCMWFVENYKLFTYWRQVAPLFDYFFTIQRGSFFEELRRLGVSRFFYLPLACDPEVHRKVELSADDMRRYGSEVSFAGSGYYNRRIMFSGLLDFDLRIWGSGWEGWPHFEKAVQNRGLEFSIDEMVKIFNATKVNLNLHSSTYSGGVERGDFVNPRTFELAACQAFQLVDERTELPELFDTSEEMICFRDLADLRRKIRYYLDHPDERTQIAKRAQARAYKDHTYEQRMRQMLSFIFSEDAVARLAARSHPDQACNLLERIGPEHDLYPILRTLDPGEHVTCEQLIRRLASSSAHQTDAELVLMMLQNIAVGGRKR